MFRGVAREEIIKNVLITEGWGVDPITYSISKAKYAIGSSTFDGCGMKKEVFASPCFNHVMRDLVAQNYLSLLRIVFSSFLR